MAAPFSRLRRKRAHDPVTSETIYTNISWQSSHLTSFSHDLRYLGAYRAWQEAVLSDRELAQKQQEIHAWTTTRVTTVFQALPRLPRVRAGVDIAGLARVMDSFFWSLLAQAVHMPEVELSRWIDSATHRIYHAMFMDPPGKAQRLKPS